MKKIKIYALSTCIWCKKTIDYFTEKGIPFEHIYVDLLEDEERKLIKEELGKFNPERSYPTIVIGHKVIIGFKQNDFEKELQDEEAHKRK